MILAKTPPSYTYDLGDLWLRKTGHPVVFAVFAIRKTAVDKYYSELNAIISSYKKSLECLKKDKKTVIEKASEKYPDIIYDIDKYYTLLKFEFTEELKKALLFYYQEGANLNLIRETRELTFF